MLMLEIFIGISLGFGFWGVSSALSAHRRLDELEKKINEK